MEQVISYAYTLSSVRLSSLANVLMFHISCPLRHPYDVTSITTHIDIIVNIDLTCVE